MSEYEFKVVIESWSGHGEGGQIASVVLDKSYGLYESTQEQIREAEQDMDALNSMRDALEQAHVDRDAWISTARGAASDVIAMAKMLHEIREMPINENAFLEGYAGAVREKCRQALLIAGEVNRILAQIEALSPVPREQK